MAFRDVLNPALYYGLCRRWGESNVEVVSPGEEIQWNLEYEFAPDGRKIYRRYILDAGEEYRMQCDICRDYRARLYFNHRWGVYDPETQSQNLWLVNCFNEGCYNDYEEQQLMRKILYEPILGSDGRVELRPGRIVAQVGLSEVHPPGPLWSLEELFCKQPDHPAITYLLERRLNPVYLSRQWGVSYCPQSQYSQASNRIIIPIYANGLMVGWQARYIGDSVNGVSFNKAGVAKYWSSPGYRRRLAAYNYDRAVQHSMVVLVEGPVDAWKVGPMAMGLVGKTMSHQVLDKFVGHLQQHDDPLVVILLDSRPDEKAKARLGHRYVHHIDKLESQLAAAFVRKIVPVWLPEDVDAGDMDRAVVRGVIRDACEARGWTASFAAPVKLVA